MVRMILGILVGFIVWSILWVGSDQLLMVLSPRWYGDHQTSFMRAVEGATTFTPDTTILLLHLVRAAVITLLAGYLAAMIAREISRAPLILGVLLLLFGIFVQAMAWNYLPMWYHLLFLLMLVPLSVAGGRLRGGDNIAAAA